MRASEVGQARAEDHEILQKPINENRILVALDGHFGDWVVLPLSRHSGVIRVKVNPAASDNIIKLLVPFLRIQFSQNFENHLVILLSTRSKWIATD